MRLSRSNKSGAFSFLYILPGCLLCVQLLAPQAFAGKDSGGGDRCEERFKSIAADLRTWIRDGGAAGLKLGSKLTPASYSAGLLKVIKNTRITCVGPGDSDYPVTVNRRPKECKNFVDDDGQRRIVCDRAKFYSSLRNPENDPVQYKIVHHEYASLAGFEKPKQDDSDYRISAQLSSFLEDQVVKRLVVRKKAPPAPRAPAGPRIGQRYYLASGECPIITILARNPRSTIPELIIRYETGRWAGQMASVYDRPEKFARMSGCLQRGFCVGDTKLVVTRGFAQATIMGISFDGELIIRYETGSFAGNLGSGWTPSKLVSPDLR